jgi:hypothetical protein
MRVNYKDLASGALFVAIGLFFALNAWFGLRIGRAFAMGPGYFPAVLGLVLVGFGLVIAALSLGKPAEPIGPVPWRGIALVIGAVVFFAAFGRSVGVAPSLALTTFAGALATKKTSLKEAIVLSLALSAFCTATFIYALGLPYPAIGPWLGG